MKFIAIFLIHYYHTAFTPKLLFQLDLQEKMVP